MVNTWLNLKYWIKHSYIIISELMNRMVNKLEVSNDDLWTQSQMMDGEFSNYLMMDGEFSKLMMDGELVNKMLNYEC